MSGTSTVAFSAITPAQQAQVLAFMQQFRPTIGAMAVALRQLQALANIWNASISSVVSTVTPTDVLPDATGLAGAQPLEAADLTAVMGMASAVLASNYAPANLAEFIKVVGPSNV